jgi:site-specific DNA-methyltransferase (adenine-specific)
MKYLVRLITPKNGIVLDPFAGSGTTGEAALLEDRKYYLIEKTEKYLKDINNRVNKVIL